MVVETDDWLDTAHLILPSSEKTNIKTNSTCLVDKKENLKLLILLLVGCDWWRRRKSNWEIERTSLSKFWLDLLFRKYKFSVTLPYLFHKLILTVL